VGTVSPQSGGRPGGDGGRGAERPARPGMAPRHQRRHGARHMPEAAGRVPAASARAWRVRRMSASQWRRCRAAGPRRPWRGRMATAPHPGLMV